MSTHLVCAIALIAAVVGAAVSAPATSGNLLVPAACPYRAGTSAGLHAGPTPIRLSGVAVLGAGVVIDAFYSLSPENPSVALGPNGGRLRWVRASESFCTCSIDCPGTRDLAASLVGAVPPFNPAHEYDVTVDFGADPVEIMLGTDDCSCDDNFGGFFVAFLCAADTDCGDGGDCTVATCGANGECRHDYDVQRCGVAFDNVFDAVLAPDGRFYVAGSANVCPEEFALNRCQRLAVARFLPDGRPDESFGPGAEIVDEYGYGARKLLLDGSGRIVAMDDDSFTRLLVRYNVDGSRDRGFGFQGRVPGIRTDSHQIALVGDRLLDVGTDESGIVLARYRDDGMLDTSFGASGIVRAGLNLSGVREILPYPAGRLLVLGYGCGEACGDIVTRFTDAGELDTAFGRGGIVATSTYVAAAAVQPDGAVVLGGGTPYQPPDLQQAFVLERYSAGGIPDLSFGVVGQARTPLGSLESAATRIAVLPDGNILAAGYDVISRYRGPYRETLSRSSLVLARYRPDGSLDPAFGFAGMVTSPFDSLLPSVLLVQPDGKFIVAGARPFYPFFLVRYESYGVVDQSFHAVGAICGDGKVAALNEECDAGAENGKPTSCCTATCGIRLGGEVCRPASLESACDVPETCDGLVPSCPEDAFAGNETPCALNDPCSTKDHCEAGRCVSGTRLCRGSAVQAATKGRKRLPRIEVTCEIERDQVPGADKGGSCHATAFVGAAKGPTGAGALSCTTAGDETASCSAEHAQGVQIARTRSKKLRKDGSVTLRLKLSREARRMLRRQRDLAVDVCAAIRLSTGLEIPLRCSGGLER